MANEGQSWYPPSLVIDFMAHYAKEREAHNKRNELKQIKLPMDVENFRWNYIPSKPIDATRLSNILFKSRVVKDLVYDVINDTISKKGKKIEINPNKGLNKEQLKTLKRIIDEGCLMDEDDDKDEFASLYFLFLYGIGYLTARREAENAEHTSWFCQSYKT